MSAVPSRDDTRFLTVEACRDLVRRAIALSTGGGETTLAVDSSWTGNLRWARNRVNTAGDVRDNEMTIERRIRGAVGDTEINQIDDAYLTVALHRAERLIGLRHENPQWMRERPYIEPYPHPPIWSDVTYNLDTAARASAMQSLVRPAVDVGMMTAGYVQVSAHGRSTMDGARVWYFPYTLAQYSVTVRDPQGTGSGWAGVDDNDWSRIDAERISAIALDKCLRSRNPVAVEPGRYTAILEPQAVCDYVKTLFTPRSLDREAAEGGESGPSQSIYSAGHGFSRIGQRIIDERLSVSSDPMDPELGFPPFLNWQVFHPVTWIADGVLKELAYGRAYAVQQLSKDTGGLPATGSFHMRVRGPTHSVDDMIATTTRGILVTRFTNIAPVVGSKAMMMTGYTRDGLWLIEHGKISKPIKNLRFLDSPMFSLNNLEQIGQPIRVFRPDAPSPYPDGYAPVIVPALTVRDFNFTSLVDAV